MRRSAGEATGRGGSESGQGIRLSWARLLMILLTLWSLGTMLPGLCRIAAPLLSYGLSVDNDGVVLDVVYPFPDGQGSPAARAGLRPGDRIDLHAMRCGAGRPEGCRAIIALLGDFGGIEYTLARRPITILLKGGGGTAGRRLTLAPAKARMHFPARLLLLLDTLVGAAFVLTAFLLVWRQPSRMAWGFFLYALWFNPGQDYAYYAFLQLWPHVFLAAQFIDTLAQGAGYAGLIAFALSFPRSRPEQNWRLLTPGLVLLGGAMAAISLAASANLFGYETSTMSQIQFFAIIPLDLLALGLLILRRRGLPPQDAARMRWALAGLIIGLPAFLAAELCQSTDIPVRLLGFAPAIGAIEILFLLHGVVAYFCGTAMARGRVVSVAIPLRRGAILACLSFILGVPIVLLHDEVSSYGDRLHERFAMPAWLWLMVVSPIALIVLTHLHHRSVHALERIFNRGYHRARERLAEAGRSMLHVRSFEEVDRKLTETPGESLALVSAAIFRQVDGQFRRSGPSPGWSPTSATTLDPERDAIVLRCLESGEAEPLPRDAWSREDLPPDDLAPCLAVPVRGGVAESLAIALFGPHRTGSDINADERVLLQDFAERAALGYDRVEVETLRRIVEHLRARAAAREEPGQRIPG